MKEFNSTNVYDAAIARATEAYRQGHRIIVAFSAGKDSNAVLEICIEAARITGRLPVEVWMRDEEIMFPGTYEYAIRVANRKEVDFHWFYARQPNVNVFNRQVPYYWVFDPQIPESQWLRKFPSMSKYTPHKSIDYVVNPVEFPPLVGKDLYVTMGVRGAESRMRNIVIHQSGGAVSGTGIEKHFRPIYDWSTKDVWLAIKEKGWDYNDAYNVMTRFGIKREQQRIAPPTMTVHGIPLLQVASRAWPEWFDRLCIRLPGVKLAALYGKQAMTPIRRPDETWKQAYQRINIDEAPAWIAARAERYRSISERQHANHSTDGIQEMANCPTCMGISWYKMTSAMYYGDPFLLNVICPSLGYLEPEDVRPGTGTWGGRPTM